MDFFYYDLGFLIIFSIAVALFLVKNRKKLQIEKILLLYRTKIGLRIIEKISRKFPKTISALSGCSIVFGYLAMLAAFLLILQTFQLLITAITVPKIPPIIPLIPYMPRIFKVSFLPPFYFTYWILTILILAVAHEFAHGIIARRNKIKLKSTGFGFLGPFLAAFVELDEAQMAKKSNTTQLGILSGGSFANFIVALLFLLLLNGFFVSAYSPAGLDWSSYALAGVNLTAISTINNRSVTGLNAEQINEQLQELKNATGGNESTRVQVKADNESYFATFGILELQLKQLAKKENQSLMLYSDTPAYRADLEGAITTIYSDNASFVIRSLDDLHNTLDLLKPGQAVVVQTLVKNDTLTELQNYTIELAQHPENASKAFLGVGFYAPQGRLVRFVLGLLQPREPFVHYEPKSAPRPTIFIYNLLLWIIIINFSVMLVNMLPFAIFDGGKFFYITALSLTRSRKKALVATKAVSSALLFLILLLMISWWIRI